MTEIKVVVNVSSGFVDGFPVVVLVGFDLEEVRVVREEPSGFLFIHQVEGDAMRDEGVYLLIQRRSLLHLHLSE